MAMLIAYKRINAETNPVLNKTVEMNMLHVFQLAMQDVIKRSIALPVVKMTTVNSTAKLKQINKP